MELPIPLLVKVDVGEYTIGAVNWTWTQDGAVNAKQKEGIARLTAKLEDLELVLCGDFNLPRNLPGGNEIYQALTAVWKDNIPADVLTSIDPDLHKANKHERGRLKWMVDYIWTTPMYKVGKVRVVSGVSDHCAVVCEIENI